MKQITLDFNTYQAELKAAEEAGQIKAVQEFKDTLIKNIEIKNIPVEDALKYRIPPQHLQGAKKPAYDWFQNNFTNEELTILFNK